MGSIAQYASQCSQCGPVLQLSEMTDQYMLARYLSNDLQYTDRVPQWTVEDVCLWLQQTGFPELCQVFRQVGVDGDLLLPLREKEMTEDLEMTNGIVRRRFLRELRNLKRMSDYTCVDAEEIAEFLSGVQPDFREYTYNLYKADMTVESMVKLCYEDLTEMLTEAGVENKVHQYMISEIVTALEAEVNIIPVTDHGFQWLARDDMHEDVRDVPSYNSVRWVHEYQDACISKLDKFIRGGDNQLKIDSPYLCRSLARSRQSSGRSTPLGMSRKSSATPFSSNLLHPRNISLRKSSLSL